MPVFRLMVRATCDGVASFSVGTDYAWSLFFLCTNCGEKSEHAIVFHETDQVELVRGGSANVKFRCKFCDRTVRYVCNFPLLVPHLVRDLSDPYVLLSCPERGLDQGHAARVFVGRGCKRVAGVCRV